MKLTTELGELPLPDNFSFTMKNTNPLLSDDGDCTIPATIPITKDVLRMFQNPDTLANSNNFKKILNATLESGIIRKNGQLVIDTFKKDEGLCVSFAEKNSDLYAKFKEKTLAQIFDGETEDERTYEQFSSVEECANYLYDVYAGDVDSNFCIFPVLVNRKEIDDNETFLINNQPDNESTYVPKKFIWQSRIVDEEDSNIWVPDGYGISPFFILYRLINCIFEKIGYKIKYNCFQENYYLRTIAILNNCSDTICKARIKYSDLVPDVTLGDFFTFLENKFHAGCFFDSSTKEVEIYLMQDILSGKPDMDITDKVKGDYTLRYDESKRIILKSDTSLEGAAPAAETLNDLLKKYKFFFALNEQEFSNFTYDDCLLYRKATGVFFDIRKKYKSDEKIIHRLGSNYFTYDRKNSKQEEKKEAADVMPPIFVISQNVVSSNPRQGNVNYDPFALKYVAPYIGKRIHKNTSFGNKENDNDEQKIILCFFGNKTYDNNFFYGTTQKNDCQGNLSINVDDLTAEDVFKKFWSKYNTILLNNQVTIDGNFLFNQMELKQLKFNKFKLFKNQYLLPETINYDIGKNVVCKDMQLILYKDFKNKIEDSIPEMESFTYFHWVLHDEEIQAIVTEISNRDYYDDEGIHCHRFLNITYNESNPIDEEPFFLGIPIEAGVINAKKSRNMVFHYVYSHGDGRTPTVISASETRYVTTYYISEEYQP